MLCREWMCAALLFHLRAYAIEDGESKVFGLQTQVLEMPTTESFLRYTFPSNNTEQLQAFTICVRLKLLQYRELVPSFSYSYSDRADNGILMCKSGVREACVCSKAWSLTWRRYQ
ncbi:uncharacterized protein [Penaeus vannamei]|uniref:uncharacterized protein n=1 Tax=Penaeus vannamei TaxID=6689 RepID=UPI00387F7222